jgi:hypothetical protein
MVFLRVCDIDNREFATNPDAAAGVESTTQPGFLHSHGDDLVQGFFFSRPVPAQWMELLLRRHSIGIHFLEETAS